jgi:hypothetical protein
LRFEGVGQFHLSKPSSRALRRHLSVLPPRLPLRISNCVDRNLPTPSTLHELRGPSAYPDLRALLFTHLLMSVQEVLLYLLKVPFAGFGYPLNGVRYPHPGGPLSAPNALGLRSSELSSSSEIEEFLSNSSFRSDVCLRNGLRLVSTFQRLALPKEAVSLNAPQRIRLGRDLLLS